MSDPVPNPASAPGENTDSNPPKPKVSRAVKWRRRLMRLAMAAVVLTLLMRALVHVLLPPVLQKVAATYGFSASYEKLELSTLGGDVGLWGLKFTPTAGGVAVLDMSYCRASISTFGLLRGHLNVRRVEAEGARLLVDRTADGQMPLVQQIISATSKSSPSSPIATTAQPVNLDPPLTIDLARLQDAAVRFIDHSVVPATDVALNLDALVSNVGMKGMRTSFEIAVHSPQALAALYVSGSGLTHENVLDADLSIRMFGLDLGPANAYLSPLGIVPVSHDLSAQGSGKLIARFTGGAASATQPATPTNLSATLDLRDLKLSSDARESGAVDHMTIEATSLTPAMIRLRQVTMDGVRGTAARSLLGRPSFAGIELAAAPTTRPARDKINTPVVFLEQLLLQNAEFSFTDKAMPQPVTFGCTMPKLSITNVCSDPTRAEGSTSVSLSASAPGIAKSIEIDGNGATKGGVASLDLSVRASGIDAQAAEPYLAMLKIKRRLVDGQFACRVAGQVEAKDDGALAGSVKVTDATFTDGGTTLLKMPLIDVRQASINSAATGVRVEAISLVGPKMQLHRGKNGLIETLGLQYDPAATIADSHSASTSAIPTPAARPLALPAIAIGKFSWRGADIRYVDSSGETPVDVAFNDLTVDGENLAFDSSAINGQPGRLHVSFKSPGIVDDFVLTGALTPAPQSMQFDVNADSKGISAENLKPLLAAIGINPVLHEAAVRFGAKGKIEQANNRLQADLNVNDFSFRDGQTNWASANGLRVEAASFDGRSFQADAIRIDKPSGTLIRGRDGAITLAGIKLPARNTAPATTMPATRLDLSLPIIVKVKAFEMHDAEFAVNDATVTPPANLSAKLDLTASQITAGTDGAPTTFSLRLSSPGIIESLKVDGSAQLAPANQDVLITASGTGIDAKAIESYLPPNVSTHFHGQQFGAALAAHLEPNPQGGSRGKLIINDFAMRDSASAPIGSVGNIDIGVDRIDLPKHRIDINQIVVTRANLSVTQDENGISMLGATLSSKPVRQIVPAGQGEIHPANEVSDVNALLAQSRQRAPLITLGKLSIDADRFSLTTPLVARPVVLTNLALTNPTRIELFGDDPTRRPPFDLQFRTGVDGLIDSIAVDSHLAPLAADPSAKIKLDATGIHGGQLTEFFPFLKEKVDTSELSNGRFTAQLDAQFGYARRGLFGIDLTRDITAIFEVKDLRLTQAGAPRTLAGLDAIRGEGVRYSPATGSLAIKSIDITQPSADIYRDNQGIHALGMIVKLPDPTKAATQPAPGNSEGIASTVAASASTQPSADRAEYRIDRFTMSGADVRIEDRVGTPATILPINQLDVDIKGLSSRALVEKDQPIRFSVLAGAGKVPLPPRKPKPGVDTEDREAFAEASAVGDLTLVPKPKGFVKASLSGLELTSIRGLAKQYGVNLSGATFDVRADVRMRGLDTFDARIYPTFNELRLSEAPNGPIQRGLKLPTPPDAVIGLLEDADGSISFPLTVPIEAGKLRWGPIIGSATGSLAEVMAGAVASAPLKAINIIPMLGGADTSPSRAKRIAPITIEFAPGESQLTSAQADQIRQAVELMRRDKSIAVTVQHTLGPADIQLEEQRTNPLAQDSLSIAINLRERKMELQKKLIALNGQIRAAIASQDSASMQTGIDSLRATAIQLKETEDALDQALDLLRPGASRQAQRRTKTGSILLADLRLASVQDVLLRSEVPAAADRVRKATAVFNPDDSDAPGHVTIVLVRQSKK